MSASVVPGERQTGVAEERVEFGSDKPRGTSECLMSLSFNKISRAGLDAASVATSIAFTAAKLGTRLGVRSQISPGSLVAHSYFQVLHNAGHHRDRCRPYRLCARLRSLWRAD